MLKLLFHLPHNCLNYVLSSLGLPEFSFLNQHIITLNTLWSNLGLTDFSFIGFLKRILFIILILLHLCLLYYEILIKEQKEKENLETLSHVQAGISPEIKKIATYIVGSVSLYASLITIKDSHIKQQKEEELRQQLAIAKEHHQKLHDKQILINYKQNSHIETINRDYQT